MSRKRTKRSRMRGSHTHGWGDKKKRRNAGNRGGKGFAGRYTGSKKPSFWAEGRKHSMGFNSVMRQESTPINVGDLNLFIEKNNVQKKGSVYEVNLSEKGYTKLLGKGTVKYPVAITVETATERAVKKIAAAGGSVAAAKTE